jgi:hypothetical protein
VRAGDAAARPAVNPGRMDAARPSYAAPERPAPSVHGARPASTRPYTPGAGPQRPVWQSQDRRYNRPNPVYVRPAYGAGRPPPNYAWYRPYYTRWYVHPYYRSVYATWSVVNFGFYCDPWSTYWAPPFRAGWGWNPGWWAGTMWWPGYWSPLGAAPVGYAYVPGYWYNDVYVDGWYRPAQRDNGWTWVDGYYLDDGTFIRGHWMPTRPGPEGYVWEPGFWDGERWVEGFWRPQFRSSYTWVSSYFDVDGIYHGGYWAPLQAQPGQVWIPGWFDGNQWVEGYWVNETEYQSTDVQSWQPEQGYDAGWEASGMGSYGAPAPQGAPQDLPLGIPVE